MRTDYLTLTGLCDCALSLGPANNIRFHEYNFIDEALGPKYEVLKNAAFKDYFIKDTKFCDVDSCALY